MFIKKGILKAFDDVNYAATVQIEGSLSVWLENIPVSRVINATEMSTGRSVAVLFHDGGNPSDCVVVAVWT
jgi:hypothetical protein